MILGPGTMVAFAEAAALAPLAPVITDWGPAAGDELGGTVVTLNGKHLGEVTLVEVDGVSVDFTVDNDRQVTMTVDPHAPGLVDIVVTNATGSDTLTDGYEFTDEIIITSCTPDHGPDTGGTSIVIIGTGFTGATFVEFLRDGASPDLSFTVDSDTQITATTPAELSGRIYDIRVTSPDGVFTLEAGYQYD